MDGLLILAFGSLLILVTFYVCIRRGRYGGLGGGESTAVAPPGVSEPGMGRVLTAEEVSRHNTPNDLWLIVNRKVYDLTDYIDLHPGGDAILRNAGRDSTAGFSGSQHPLRVWDMIQEFYIGDLTDDVVDRISVTKNTRQVMKKDD